jgi:hypothetical protein
VEVDREATCRQALPRRESVVAQTISHKTTEPVAEIP